MDKRVVMIAAVIGLTLGALVPQLWGDTDPFSLASILLGMFGGFGGIYLAFWLGRHT